MQLRYMGFDQARNVREYRFDGVAHGEATRHFVVTADLALFVKHRVGIQEGPALCLQKLAADLEAPQDVSHELTDDDLLAYTSVRASAEARREGARKLRAARDVAVANE